MQKTLQNLRDLKAFIVEYVFVYIITFLHQEILLRYIYKYQMERCLQIGEDTLQNI